MDKYTRDELIIEAETLEECGEYIHMDLIGYTAEQLREAAELKRDSKIDTYTNQTTLHCGYEVDWDFCKQN